jgi:hypothetical protein
VRLVLRSSVIFAGGTNKPLGEERLFGREIIFDLEGEEFSFVEEALELGLGSFGAIGSVADVAHF